MALLLLSLPLPLVAQQPDTARLYRDARTAEAAYERALRWRAPLEGRARSGAMCDEQVGRFCLTHDSGRQPLPPEPPEVAPYRERAINALRSAFEADAGRRATAFALVRVLLDGKRNGEAAAVAEAYEDVSDDVAHGRMLLGLARHAAGDIPAAEAAFARWQSLLEEAERRQIRDLANLLGPAERKRYRERSPGERAAYRERYWRFADALYMTPGNETYADHLARHAETRLLAEAPVVAGSTSWGSDLEELTVRYGSPKARTRVWPGSSMGGMQIVEHFDPDQLTYAAPALDSVLSIRPRPRMGWPMDTVRSRSGHAPPTIRRMLALEHQASVFPAEPGATLLVEGVLPLDSARAGQRQADGRLFLLDSLLHVIAVAAADVRVAGDSVFLSGAMRLPAAARYYSLEVLEPGTRLAGRARFPIDRPMAVAGLSLSDIQVDDPDLLVVSGQPIGLRAEIRTDAARPRPARIQVEMTSSDGKSVLVRAVRWIGERLGFGDRAAPTRMSWIEQLQDVQPNVISVRLDAGRLEPGRYLIEMGVTDLQTGALVRSVREIAVIRDSN